MTKIKESSTRNANKLESVNNCPVSYLMDKIGGYWKPIILFQLMNGQKRYSEIKRAIPAVTEKMLIQHLKQLQEDGLVLRTSEPVVPPYVVYSLTEDGEALTPVLQAMAAWGINNMSKQGKVSMAAQIYA